MSFSRSTGLILFRKVKSKEKRLPLNKAEGFSHWFWPKLQYPISIIIHPFKNIRPQPKKYPLTSHLTEKNLSSSQTVERPYSPSFAREGSATARQQQQQQQQQAFVVLDSNAADDASTQLPRGRRRTDRHYDPRDSLAGRGGPPRSRTPPNWMPPWYDSSTSTIWAPNRATIDFAE